METTHTKTPWTITTHADGTFNIYTDGNAESMADETLVAHGIKSYADALLFLHSPELLAALDDIVMLNGRSGNALFDFEEQADRFLRDTGILRFRKSQSPHMDIPQEYRIKEYSKWTAKKLSDALYTLAMVQKDLCEASGTEESD